MLKVFDLSGKVALITGASRGLGKAAATALAQSNANVIVVGRNRRTIEDTANEIGVYGRRVVPFVGDVTSTDTQNSLRDFIREDFGKLDILVNNAGIAVDKPFLQTSDEDIERLIKTNLLAVMQLTRTLGEFMVEQKGGKIINIGSYDGLVGTPNLVAYGTSKGGVIQFTRMLAVEWARYNININVICPGYFRTAMNDEVFINEELAKKIIRRIPLRRIGQPDEIGPLIVYLASNGSDYMTGQVIALDGGETAS